MDWTGSEQRPEEGFFNNCNGLQFRNKGYILMRTKYSGVGNLASELGNILH
jgi:hypothetical protein